MSDVTLIITSCNRCDLLSRAFKSIINTNEYPIKRYIIIDDSGIPNINDFIKNDYPELDIELIYNSPKLGQLRSIDLVYSMVDTEYIFHCEEDWEFKTGGYIEYSKSIIESDNNVLLCWLRGDDDTNGHPIDGNIINNGETSYRLMSTGYRGVWHGFTLNPSLIKLSNYKLVSPYSGYENEHNISEKYYDLGFRCAKSNIKYVEHIGWGRHIN